MAIQEKNEYQAKESQWSWGIDWTRETFIYYDDFNLM